MGGINQEKKLGYGNEARYKVKKKKSPEPYIWLSFPVASVSIYTQYIVPIS